MQRICAAALLCNGTCVVNNIGTSNDDVAAMNIIQQLGATIKKISVTNIEITAKGTIDASGVIDCSESGLSTRLFTIIASLSPNEITITGSGSLVNRSMVPFLELFQQLGVEVKDFNGKLPITIKGPLQPQSTLIDGSLSSQFLSGLLLAYAFTAKEEVTIRVSNLVSRPYIDLTIDVLHFFKKKVTNNNYEAFTISPTSSTEETIAIDVEGDWSSAAFWLVAGAINGSITISGLNCESTQADKAILTVLQESGVEVIVAADKILVQSAINKPQGFSFDATNAPDLFPILAIYAALCSGESEIKGLHRLSQKESDRAMSIKEMLSAFGVTHTTKDDSLLITGAHTLQAATIDSYNDHRIAMAATIGALNATGNTTIVGAEAVNKSYTNFYKDLQLLGGVCHTV